VRARVVQLADGKWLVKTDQGDITAEHVVSCSGNFARKTGAMVGLDIPVIPVEHQYIVTEPHPLIKERQAKGLPEMGVLREADSSWYMREENGGLLLGPYEKGAPVCYVDGPSDQSEYELFQEDLDRLAPYIETAIARVPAFGEVGIKKVYNGAIAYTPDGSPIIGPAWDKKNFWLNEGHSFGVTAAGGAGWQLAEWIVDGEPTIDMMGVDPRRFGPYATKGYLITKNEEAYSNVFTPHYPDEERSAARPLKRTAIYDRMKDLGAVFGSVYGWERPGWFAPKGYGLSKEELNSDDTLTNHNHAPVDTDGKIKEKWSFRRSNYFKHVGDECLNVMNGVGIQDMSAFAKMEVSGPGARDFLESILANKIPKKQGRIALCHLLSPRGGVRAEFTVYEWAPGRFYLVSTGAYERHDHDYLRKLAPTDGSVRLNAITSRLGVIVLAGPMSRKLLSKLTRTDLSNEAFPWLSGKEISVGTATAHVLRVNFVGELGYEFHVPVEQQIALFDLLMDAGKEFGIKPYGIKAMSSLSLEKSYRLIPRELSIEYSAYESGLDRFVHPNKGQFIGRDALVAGREKGLSWNFVTTEVHGVTDKDSDARGSEPIYAKGKLVGRATNGGYGWRCKKSLALAMVKPDYAQVGTSLEIKILGKIHEVTVGVESPYDPNNEKLKG
jgi:dimethylglycine dehydrogenase